MSQDTRNNQDLYNQKYSDLAPKYQDELVNLYKGQANHCDHIYFDVNKTIINWIFIINTGSVIAVLSLITSKNKPIVCWFVAALAFFILGIIFIFASLFLERKKFCDKGDSVEKAFAELHANKIKGRDFINELYPNASDKRPQLCEYIGIIFTVLGIASGVWAFFNCVVQ